ncbi:phosphatidylglycerophosphatase A [Kordiimonas sp. SCSIO 12610]|uniref:phosphatidylglycerophosphatase A family protein n=1 Tax=Kordiimonas sp. SCSIO 12610 TaxID=2829597 RepID=UPI00210DCE84|nr:phosphatidylglycerophosphatase A [Kordiimonas sp. SCSIO 12610]UTW54018.1 phosphatidylglycerophosphatase A [Kordiimonas sp. SCSIO 12610]
MAKQSLQTWNGRYKSIAFWFTTGFGSGLLRPAPGTWGSLAGVAIALALLYLHVSSMAFAALIIISFALSIFAINTIEKKTGIHDAPEIVIDEFVGQWIVMIPLFFEPHFDWQNIWPYALGAFILFRIFDIIKPWPINWLDKRVSGGFGVMIDDVIAGGGALIILQAVYYFT